ncbi:putative delta-5 fatty acid desaturase [Trypanosoma grayi]|uniref:putative delta-5 fatty acid desaturase n=1 Tax=Trypanosoma grayi TaxID=71804 RepID=UPI0004F460ED|nr:putative delta-5 fatty acid desaturase [Trypanosoma grayi]KEG11593.1 putative delta-5 fatty acid desaturase [Trypanosoma grayi]
MNANSVSQQQQQLYEVLINGRLYDCRNFKHPGGSVLRFFCGSGDATETFMEFHMRMPKAAKQLQQLPSRPAPEWIGEDLKETARLKKLSRDFNNLRTEFVQEGMYDPSYLHVFYRLGELVVMHALGLYLLLWTPYWIPACVLLGIAEGRCGWVEHEGGHHSLFGNHWLDQKIQEVCYGLGDGMSAAWWRSQHNKHHATPQKLRHDADLDTLPLVAFNRIVAEKARNSSLVRRWLSMQMYLFVPITCSLVALSWQLFLHPRHMIRTRRYTEMACAACRLLLILAICRSLQLTLLQSIGGYLFYQFFGAAYIFVNFALSHSHLGVLSADAHVHWVEFASVYTINIAPHWLTNWWMGYLNFQIEHHLFPTMPQFRFVSLYPRVRRLFEDNGLKYDCRPYWDAMSTTFRNLGHVGDMFKESS